MPTLLLRLPWLFLAAAAGLVSLGLCGIGRGDELVGNGIFHGRQVMWLLLAVPLFVATASFNYRRLAEHAWLIYGASVVLLVAVFLFRPVNGARRWIPLGLFNFQPSELAKLAVILVLSEWLRHRGTSHPTTASGGASANRTFAGLFVPFGLSVVPLVLVLKEPNLGGALLFLPVLYAMLFAAGGRASHLAFVGLLGLAVAPLLWSGMSVEQRSRITALFLQKDGGPAPKGDNYHLHQAKQLHALGGWWGSEFQGEAIADPAAYHLPESRTDFVFCLIGERFGFAGCAATLVLYSVLFLRGLMLAAATRDPFGRLLIVGVVALLATQTAINAGMTVGLMPITGVTLPLMSYGGSSLLATSMALGFVVSVALHPGYELAGEPFR